MAIPRNLSILAQGASVSGVLSVTYGGTGVTTSTGTGSVVLSNSPSLTSPSVGSGNLTFSTTGQRITGDFSNATVANRVLLQSTTSNANSFLGIVPNGTGNFSGFNAFNTADPTNSTQALFGATSVDVRLVSTITGTGTYLPMTFYTGGSERMRILTTGEVGIGTSSPAWKLDIRGADAVAQVKATSGSATLIIDGFDGTSYPGINLSQGGVNYWSVQQRADTNLYLYRQSGSGAVLIPSGNVGIGTSSPGFKLEVVGGTNNGIHIKDAASATVFGGLFTQASNMALITRSNHALTFGTNDAERMRITSVGDVGIGTSSPSQKFHVSGSGSTYTRVSSSNAGSGAGSYFVNATSTWLIGAGPASGGSEFQFVDQTSGSLERARITSNGDLLLNTTSTSLTSGIGAKFINSATDPYMGYVTTSSSGASNYHLYSTGAAAYRFYVDSSGTIYATSTTITSLSDQRLKENIQDIDVGLDAIMALKPRKFDWKTGKGKDKKGDRGWVAQEFEQVFPEMVDNWKDPAPENEEPYKSVNADLIPVLVKAIQELKAQNDELMARVAALEGKA